MGNEHRKMSSQDRLAYLIDLADGQCTWCGYDLSKTNARPTRDHLVPKIKGGPTRLENEVVSCSSCNGKRGTTPPGQWIEQCRHERAVEPNAQLVADQLQALTDAIAREGGMRKIRKYVARELKRVSDLVTD